MDQLCERIKREITQDPSRIPAIIGGPEQLCPECYRLWELGESDA